MTLFLCLIQLWPFPKNTNVTFTQRDIPLTPVRVASVFAEKPGAAELSDDIPEGEPFILDKKREVFAMNFICLELPMDDDSYTVYMEKSHTENSES